MVNKSKARGTAAETAVVRYLQAHGWPNAERRQLAGALDKGDVIGTPGICWEVKAHKDTSDSLVAAWMVETEVERVNAAADWGVLVVKRPGHGPANVGSWWAIVGAATVFCPVVPGADLMPVRLLLADAVRLLHATGYGTPSGGAS